MRKHFTRRHYPFEYFNCKTAS